MDTRLSRIEEQNTQIMLALQKKKKGVFFVSLFIRFLLLIQPVRVKINNLGYRPGPTQTDLYSHVDVDCPSVQKQARSLKFRI